MVDMRRLAIAGIAVTLAFGSTGALGSTGVALPSDGDIRGVDGRRAAAVERTGAAKGPDSNARARALRTAQAEGRRVEITRLRTPTGRVFANPDGTLTAEEHVVPVRVRQDGEWVPVDTRLAAQPNGGLAPRAAPVDVAFSGGGSAPLVRLEKAGRQIELTWPQPLPAPVVDGSTATYREVYPGVDLRLTATAEGFSEVLVVKNRQAARNPALTEIDFGLRTRGVSLRSRPDGTLVAVDGDGDRVFQSAPPQMWDTPAPKKRARPTSAGAQQATGRFRLAARQLTMVPDQKLLTSPTADFPILIDPSFDAGRTGWTKVLSGHPNQSYWKGGVDGPLAKAGRCGWAGCNGIGVARSYFRFDVRRVLGTHILGAEFRAFESWAPSCNKRAIDLYRTGNIGPGTTWNNQPGRHYVSRRIVARGYSAACPAKYVGFNATPAVRAAVNHNSPRSVLMLRARYENDKYAWKKFRTGGKNVVLEINYNSYPNAPTGLSAEGKACASAPNEPYVNPLNDGGVPLGPRLRARMSDPDGGLVRAQFAWYRRGGAKLGAARSAWQSSGTVASVTVPSGVYADGANASYRVRVFDGTDWGRWSRMCDVTIDRTNPANPPDVQSSMYPEYDIDNPQSGGAVGRTGAFTLTSRDPDVVGFRYGLSDPPTRYVAATQLGGTATAMATPEHDLLSTLFVRSVDRAGNLGPVGTYEFLVGRGTPPVGHWRLEGFDETAVPDSSPYGHHGTITPGPASWTSGRIGDALHLDGQSGHVKTTNGPTIRTDRTFSVAAWVRLDRAGDSWHVAVSQDGARTSGFYLQYASDVRTWSFNMMRTDSDNATPDRVTADQPAQVGVWTHLVGVYDRATGQMRLYVDGVRQSDSATHSPTWNATGPAQIGRVRWNGGYDGYWPGSIDDVRIYKRALSVNEIHDLATSPAVEELFLPLDEASESYAPDASGHYRTGTLREGATWSTDGWVGDGSVRLDGAGATVTTGSRAVRTDRSFTVSAAVRLDAGNAQQPQAVVSQDGPRSSGFVLGYEPGGGRWRFAVSTKDADNPSWVTVNSVAPAQTEVWTKLTGVYDAAAGEVRLYIDGSLRAKSSGVTTSNVAGDLVVGRMKLAGQPVAYLDGAVDDVHVYTGVRTRGQVRDWFLHPVTERRSPYTGQVGRYVNHASDHFTATGPAPSGYHLEQSLGLPAPAGAEDTRMLYTCRIGGADTFTSPDRGCEGQVRIGTLGRFYTEPPADVPTMPIYRCRTGSGHFNSTDPDCEGQTVDGMLGYSRAYAHLVRHRSPSYPYDHKTSIGRVAADYLPEIHLGVVALTDMPGTTALMSCRDGTDAFVSDQADCEGKTVVGEVGRIWTAPPEGVGPGAELFRCEASWGDLFESLDPGCEEYAVDRSLGYVVTGSDQNG